jgi:hypothetical protein
VEDCSFTEIYCGKRLALIQKNHVFGKKYVGFKMFGIRHFLLTNKVEILGTHYVADILEKMIEACPNEVPKENLKTIKKILKNKYLRIYIPPI